ncbi:MAG TPA: trehalose-phosphatase [Ktedonobacterales bacterium]|jgi:trehalose 6-phosphate phosphatase
MQPSEKTHYPERRDGSPSISPFPREARAAGTLPPGLTAEQAHSLLAELESRPRGLLLDVDGTLSPIAITPEEARLLPGITALLEQAPQRFEVVAAISGRSAADARQIVGAPHLLYIGNHGLDRWEPGKSAPETAPEAVPFLPAIAQALDQAEQKLAPRLPGVYVERKGASGSVHTRRCANPQQALEIVVEALRPIAYQLGLRLTRGRLIAEFRPPIALDKGAAVERLVDQHGLTSALYMGDDITDLDAFRALHRLREAGVCMGIAVAVLHEEGSSALAAEADLALPSIEAVPAFLAWLLDAV